MCPFHRAIAAERIGKNVNARIGLPKRVYNSQHSALRAPQVASVLQSANCAQGFQSNIPSVGALEAATRGGTPSRADKTRTSTESPHPSPTHPNGIVKAPTHEYFIEK